MKKLLISTVLALALVIGMVGNYSSTLLADVEYPGTQSTNNLLSADNVEYPGTQSPIKPITEHV